jgi:L-methionine (R)-S-oxide reductase
MTEAQRAVDRIREKTGRRWVGIYEVTAGEVRNVAWSGPSAPAHPVFPVDKGLTGTAIASRATVVSNDVAADPRYLTALDSTGSELIAPILVDGEVRGTLDVEDERTGAFSADDVAQFEALAEELVPLFRAA